MLGMNSAVAYQTVRASDAAATRAIRTWLIFLGSRFTAKAYTLARSLCTHSYFDRRARGLWLQPCATRP